MRIEFLDQHAHHVATLAAWHHGQWGHLYDDWTREVAQAELAMQARQRELPTALVALDGAQVIGSVSLVLEDAAEFSGHGSPWLASLFVLQQARGRGVGAHLVRAAVNHAAHLGVEQLFLFTPLHAAFYQRLGWRQVMATTLKGQPVDLMDIHPVGAARLDTAA